MLATLSLGAAALSCSGCAGAFYGATTGAYLAAEAHTNQSYENYGSSGSCSGSDADAFLIGAVIVGATIGAVIEIFKWAADGCSNW